jgi:hypothetical protein
MLTTIMHRFYGTSREGYIPERTYTVGRSYINNRADGFSLLNLPTVRPTTLPERPWSLSHQHQRFNNALHATRMNVAKIDDGTRAARVVEAGTRFLARV